MNDCDEELRKAVALFRYGLIADVLRVPPGSREIRRTLREKAQRTYTIPGTRRTRVAVETMRDWLSLYRTGGFEALYPKTRADRGQPRRLPPEVAELLVSLKTAQPALSVKALIGAARERGVEHPLAPSTVHRLLSREGLLDKRCCFALCLVGSPRVFVGVFRRRIAWDDGAIREPAGAGGVAFPMNRCCRSGEDVGARAASVGKRWGSVSFSRACPHGPQDASTSSPLGAGAESP